MDNVERIRRIAVLSRRLRWAIWIGLALLIVVVFAAVIGIGFGVSTNLSLEGNTVALEKLAVGERLLILLLLSPMFVLGGWLIWSWDRLLALYQRGVIFSADNAAIIRRCGQLIIALAIVDTVVMPLGVMVLARALPDTHVAVEPNLGLLLVGVGIIVVGHVMSLGADMAEEASLTV